MQKEEQGHQEAVPDQNPQLPDDRAKEIHALRQKDIRPHQVPIRTGRAQSILRSLRLNAFQPIISNRAQGNQKHKRTLLLLYQAD